MSAEEIYWAKKPPGELAAEIVDRFERYHTNIEAIGYLARIRACYNAFYGIDKDGVLEISSSKDGSLHKISVNHFKNLITRLHILITQNKLNFIPRARNTDAKSQIETDLGKGILEYYQDEKHMGQTFSHAVLTALVCLEAFEHNPWDDMAGQALTVDPVTGKVIKTGDQTFEVYTPFDVARSLGVRNSPWHTIRLKMNKYDLAAKYSEFASDIVASGTNEKYNIMDLKTNNVDLDEDLTDVFLFYHNKTDALPEGRETWVVSGMTEPIVDKPLRYEKAPINRLSAGDVIAQFMGDSPAVDLLSLQQAIDAMFSAVTTNNLNHSVQNIWSPDPNVTVKKLANGQNLIKSTVKPEALQLTQSSGETYKLIESYVNQQQLLSGVNASARGTPEASLKSGNSLALMLAQAIQYVSVLQDNYARFASDVGSDVINNLQKFASSEMVAVIGGVSKKSFVRKFKSEDIMGIDRVSVDLGNPISQSVAGRYEIMQQLLQFGAVKDPETLLTFLKTGEIESVTEDKFKDMTLIREENEMLKRGEIPPVMITDLHPGHIQEHKEVFSDPEMRNDPELLAAATQHIQDHVDQWVDLFMNNPTLAAALGMPPPPMMAPPMPGPGGEMPAEGGGGPAPAGMDPSVQGVDLPNLPPNAPQESVDAYSQVQVANQGVPDAMMQ